MTAIISLWRCHTQQKNSKLIWRQRRCPHTVLINCENWKTKQTMKQTNNNRNKIVFHRLLCIVRAMTPFLRTMSLLCAPPLPELSEDKIYLYCVKNHTPNSVCLLCLFIFARNMSLLHLRKLICKSDLGIQADFKSCLQVKSGRTIWSMLITRG